MLPYSKEQLEEHVKGVLDKCVEEVNIEIEKNEKYLILRITATDKIIDSCHDKLEFDREWAFRAKDEVGELLRAKAYPILAEIELWLRNFIKQAMINVLGFDWWNSFISDSFQKRIRGVEEKAGKHQVRFHHQIEFTFFDDLIAIVTAEFQAWPSEKTITVNDLYELLSTSSSIEEIQQEINNRRKVVSFWNDIFSEYFEDKGSWDKIKKDIEKIIIPIRNKVMHHRLFRNYELNLLEKFKEDLKQVLSLAKSTLSEDELEKSKSSTKVIIEQLRYQIDPEILKRAMQASAIDPEVLKRAMQASAIDPKETKNEESISDLREESQEEDQDDSEENDGNN